MGTAVIGDVGGIRVLFRGFFVPHILFRQVLRFASRFSGAFFIVRGVFGRRCGLVVPGGVFLMKFIPGGGG